MYFSEHNKDVVCNNHYSGLLEVKSTGPLCLEDAQVFPDEGEDWAGEYDAYAEDFAREKGLRFLHCDIPLGEDVDEKHHERDVITLRFHPKDAPDIHHNIFSPGSSAGSFGGGEVASALPRDFYVGCTPEQFADCFPEDLREQLLANDMLRRFLEAANRRIKKRSPKKETAR